MTVIPVIDLSNGVAVLARPGGRERYRPIDSPLCRNGEVMPLVQRLSDTFNMQTLYLADLDAIRGGSEQLSLIADIGRRFPSLTLWLDGGFDTPAAIERTLVRLDVRPVIGSETWRHGRLPDDRRCLLSLDRDDTGLRDPSAIAGDPRAYPRDLILMDLARVGSALGPDLDRIRQTARQTAPGTRLYSAGGVRDVRDLHAIRAAGASGVLLASALHSGAIGSADLAGLS